MEASLTAVARDGRGKNEARRLRRSGQLPAVLYGGESVEGAAVTVDPSALLKIFHSDSGVNTLIALSVDGGTAAQVLVKEFQLDPVTDQLLHVDFYRVAMDKALTVTVPVVLHGEPVGVKMQDGIIDFLYREVQVECLPSEIPEHIDVDVSHLEIGQGVRLREVLTGVTWSPVSDADTLLVHVIAPKVEEEAAAEETEAGAGEGDAPEAKDAEDEDSGGSSGS